MLQYWRFFYSSKTNGWNYRYISWADGENIKHNIGIYRHPLREKWKYPVFLSKPWEYYLPPFFPRSYMPYCWDIIAYKINETRSIPTSLSFRAHTLWEYTAAARSAYSLYHMAHPITLNQMRRSSNSDRARVFVIVILKIYKAQYAPASCIYIGSADSFDTEPESLLADGGVHLG